MSVIDCGNTKLQASPPAPSILLALKQQQNIPPFLQNCPPKLSEHTCQPIHLLIMILTLYRVLLIPPSPPSSCQMFST